MNGFGAFESEATYAEMRSALDRLQPAYYTMALEDFDFSRCEKETLVLASNTDSPLFTVNDPVLGVIERLGTTSVFYVSRTRDTSAQKISAQDLRGKVWVLNVWASWCVACRIEHPLLVEFSKAGMVPIYGLNYKDKRDDAIRWLVNFGNPYTRSLSDIDGLVGIDFGVHARAVTRCLLAALSPLVDDLLLGHAVVLVLHVVDAAICLHLGVRFASYAIVVIGFGCTNARHAVSATTKRAVYRQVRHRIALEGAHRPRAVGIRQ
jgi:cytochrome c biogenesis protein CcmG/thiol:disulfide interchange protein DsbE